ncbi:MAG: hypothetical protein ACOVP5_06930, partial [Chitinophagales bacterium]
EVYNIAFILPINTAKISPGDGKERAASMPSETRDVLGFWEGVNIAFSKVKRMNTKYVYHIWDNARDDSSTMQILEKLKRHNIDAVVAPFHTKQALLVSNYCRENKIPMILAQNPSDVPAKDNPYAFKLQIPKSRLFYDYYIKITSDITYNNDYIYFVYDATSKTERRIANYLKYMAERDGTNRLRTIEYNGETNLSILLDTNTNNVLMISHYKYNEVNEILDKLLSIDSRRISVFGNNLWSSNPKISLEKLEKFNTRIYTDVFLQNNPSLIGEIKERYKSMTNDQVVTDVFIGYDVGMYLAHLIDKFGVKFPLSVDGYKYYGAVSNIHIKPSYNPNGKILFFENTSKFLLQATKNGWHSVE